MSQGGEPSAPPPAAEPERPVWRGRNWIFFGLVTAGVYGGAWAAASAAFALGTVSASYAFNAHRYIAAAARPKRQKLRQLRAVHGALVLLSVVCTVAAAVVGRRYAGVVAVVCTSYVLTQVLAVPWLTDLRNEAGLRRLMHADNLIRRAVDSVRWLKPFIRKDRSAYASRAHGALLVVSLLASVTAITNDRQWPQTLAASRAAAIYHLLHTVVDDKPPTPLPSPQPSPSAPPPRSGPAPSTGAGPSCPSPDQVRASFASHLPAGVAATFYSAWYRQGSDAAGCPAGKPRRVGRLWVQELTGAGSGAFVTGDARTANVVFPDFAGLVLSGVGETASVDPRVRWGLGTQQLIHNSNGSCALLQRYGAGVPVRLPPAVTAAVLETGSATGSVPRVTVLASDGPRDEYRFDLLAPGPRGPRTQAVLHIVYDRVAGRASGWPGGPARDADKCPNGETELERAADRLEAAVQAASSAGHGRPVGS